MKKDELKVTTVRMILRNNVSAQ